MSDPRPDGFDHFPSPTGVPPVPDSGLDPADLSAAAKARYDKELEAWLEDWKQQAADSAKEIEVQEARQDADIAAETALVKSVHDAYVATTQSSLDRALTRMNVVTASVGAITTVYTGLLALVYAAKTGAGKPFTLVGVVPALFLGLALFLVTVYAAMFRKSIAVQGPLLASGSGGQVVELRLVAFMQWCFGGVLARAWALHAGIVSMGVGIATLPLPFVKAPTWLEILVFSLGLLAVLVTAVFSSALNNEREWATRILVWLKKLPI